MGVSRLVLVGVALGLAIPGAQAQDNDLAVQAVQERGAPKPWRNVRGFGRVLDLTKLPVVIDEPGIYAIDRDWRIPRSAADVNPELIRITVQDVTLDLHGFEISADINAPPASTLIAIAGGAEGVEIRNGGLSACCDGAVAVHSAGAGTNLHHLRIFSNEPMMFEADGATISDSDIRLRASMRFAGRSNIERNAIDCNIACAILTGDRNVVTNNRMTPANSRGIRIVGNGNLVADNVMDATNVLHLAQGFDVAGDHNVLRNNTVLIGFIAVETLWRISGTANTLDGNIGAPSEPLRQARIGIEFTADGNFYGDNRMAAEVPFSLGGTVQTDWGGNVGY